MNINMLRDTDDNASFYAAACGTVPANWRGAVLYESRDAGASYVAVGEFQRAAVIGLTTNALGNFFGGNTPDEKNSVNIRLSGGGTLSSTTFAGLLEGTNACVIGDEILHFRTATLQVDGTYTLSGFLRGRRGSEYAMSQHVAGDRFVLLSTSTMIRVPADNSDIGKTYTYKAVSVGSTLADTVSEDFTNSGAGLKPYSPVLLGGGRNASLDITINWTRRGRISGSWRDSVDVPVGETSEEYVVEIYSDGTYTTLKRTIGGIVSQTTTYSAADQTTDFGSTQSTIYFKVYQLSSIVGRGYAASGSV